MDADDMPPPSAVMKKPAPKRVLPPVPKEVDDTTPARSAASSSSNTAASAAAAASTTAAPVAAVPASAHAPTRPSAAQPPGAPGAAAASIYTLPLWSGAPQHSWSLEVIKSGTIVETIPLAGKSHFLLGRAADMCDVVLEHASVSRRHAVLQFHENGALYLYDLGTAHGTFRNKQQVKPNTFIEVKVGDILKFAASTRDYVIEGPEEFRPKEIDRDAIRKRNEETKKQHEERLAALAKSGGAATSTDAAAESSGAAWGQGEDAVDSSDDENEEGVSAAAITVNEDGTISRGASESAALPEKLTPAQEKLLTKLNTKREKLQHLATEVDTLRSKDIRQGGLTAGQEAQIARNEERMKVLAEEVEAVEQQLRESVDRVSGDRKKSRAAMEAKLGLSSSSSKRSDDEDAEDLNAFDEEDDFYDRTKSKPHVQQTSSNASSTASAGSVLSSFTPLEQLKTPEEIAREMTKATSKRDQLRLTLKEVIISETKAKARASTADSLDSFMSTISTSQLSARRDALKSDLQVLQLHYVKLERLAEQRKGEEMRRRYLEGDAEAFKKPTATAQSAASGPAPMEVDDEEKKTSTPAAASTIVGPTLPLSIPAPTAPVTPAAAGSTADLLSRMKKKAESKQRREEEERRREEKFEQAKKEMARAKAELMMASSAPSAHATAPSAGASSDPSDRVASLAAQLSAARSSLHRDYSSVEADEVTLRLRAAAERSAKSFATGLTGQEEKGGLHVRRRGAGEEAHDEAAAGGGKRMRHEPSATPAGARGIGPSGPLVDHSLAQAQMQDSVEWVAPVSSSAGQEKLKAKFAGRY